MEFYLALKDNQAVEFNRVRPIAEAIRMSTWWLVNLQLKTSKRIRKKEKIMQFAWEETDRAKTQSPKEMKNVMRVIAAATKKKNKKKKK